MITLFPFALFMLSFLPLWISIIFICTKSILIDKSSNLYTEILCIAFIIIFFILSLFIVFNQLKVQYRNKSNKLILTEYKEEKAISSEYLLSNILPLFAFDFTSWSSVVLFLIFFITLGYLYTKHRYLTTNIMLIFANYRIYQCSFEDNYKVKVEHYLISKRQLYNQKGCDIYIVMLNNELAMDVTEE